LKETSPPAKAAAVPLHKPAPAGPQLAASSPARAAQPAAVPAPDAAVPARPPAGRARLKRRHFIIAATFTFWVLLPVAGATFYLYAVAKDQYASNVGFSVRKEEMGSAIELLGGITELSGSSTSDTDVLYKFIQSQQLVRAVGARLDLPSIYGRPGDPIFTLGDDRRIEALARYWSRMVKVFYDSASGLIEVRVLAFEPQDALDISEAIFDESSRMINQLSAIARNDATRYAREELNLSVSRLKEARSATTAFRMRTRIVDPQTDMAGRMGLVNTLQAQLASALIDLDLLMESAGQNDPRVVQAQKRVDVIALRIDAERDRFSDPADGVGSEAYSNLIAEYEALAVDQEFAEKSYLSSLATYDTAVAEGQRQSRYLATHIPPTIAQTAEYPRRRVLLALVGAFVLISWSIMVMIYYSLRDRR
jgi:capsular polysaccharide transport system permease protein